MSEFFDINVEKVIGLDIDEEDRSVGIFGNSFSLGFKTDAGEITLNFDDEQIEKLVDALKPVIQHREMLK